MRDPKAIIGCLDTLKQRGLITEPSRGIFVRVPIRDNEAIHTIIEEVKKEDIMSTNARNNAPMKKTTIEKLTELSSKATGLAAQMKSLASDLEIVAIELEDEIHDSSEAVQKLTQLQQLLKGLA
jgi:phenylpyruvate tautomerase PptA (4-oxalocrotonate tautomerase family)